MPGRSVRALPGRSVRRRTHGPPVGAVIDVLCEVAEFTMMKSGESGLELTYANTIQDLVMSLSGAAVGAIVMATVLGPAAGTPANLFGWSN